MAAFSYIASCSMVGMTDVLDELTASITRVLVEVDYTVNIPKDSLSTLLTESVKIYQTTRCKISGDRHLLFTLLTSYI
jgi:hypothetical protein